MKKLNGCTLDQKHIQPKKVNTVKPVLSGHSKNSKKTTKVLMENGILMKAEIIAECSPWSILQYF